MINRLTSASLLIFLTAFLCFPAHSQPFEDWSEKNAIDCSEWRTSDFQVYTAAGRLNHELRAYSSTPDIFCRILTRFGAIEDDLLMSASATVRLVTANLAPGMTETFTALDGGFYNAVADGPGDNIGDVFVMIKFGYRGNGGLEAWYEIFESTSADFTAFNLTEGTIVDTTAALSLNTDYDMGVSYNGDKTFTFTFNGVSVQADGPNRVGAARFKQKRIQTRSIFTSPLTGDADPNKIHVQFDDVMVDGLAYEDFTGPLANSKWRNDEQSIYVENDEVRFRATIVDTTLTSLAGHQGRYPIRVSGFWPGQIDTLFSGRLDDRRRDTASGQLA